MTGAPRELCDSWLFVLLPHQPMIVESIYSRLSAEHWEDLKSVRPKAGRGPLLTILLNSLQPDLVSHPNHPKPSANTLLQTALDTAGHVRSLIPTSRLLATCAFAFFSRSARSQHPSPNQARSCVVRSQATRRSARIREKPTEQILFVFTRPSGKAQETPSTRREMEGDLGGGLCQPGRPGTRAARTLFWVILSIIPMETDVVVLFTLPFFGPKTPKNHCAGRLPNRRKEHRRSTGRRFVR